MSCKKFLKLCNDKNVHRVLYKNYRGEINERSIIINDMSIGSTKYHPEKQLLLHVHDIEKGALRDYAAKDILKFCEVSCPHDITSRPSPIGYHSILKK